MVFYNVRILWTFINSPPVYIFSNKTKNDKRKTKSGETIEKQSALRYNNIVNVLTLSNILIYSMKEQEDAGI